MNVNRRVVVFGIVAFAFSWLFWIPDALNAQGIWNAPQGIQDYLAGPFNLGPWGPLIAAIVVTFFFDGSGGVGTLLRRGLKVVAGLMWGLWHLPLFFVPRAEFYYNRPLWGLLLTTTLVGIIIAWIFVNTNGSVFAAMLAHTMFNWSNYVFPSLGSDMAALTLFGLYGIVVAYILLRFGYRTFSRNKPRSAPGSA